VSFTDLDNDGDQDIYMVVDGAVDSRERPHTLRWLSTQHRLNAIPSSRSRNSGPATGAPLSCPGRSLWSFSWRVLQRGRKDRGGAGWLGDCSSARSNRLLLDGSLAAIRTFKAECTRRLTLVPYRLAAMQQEWTTTAAWCASAAHASRSLLSSTPSPPVRPSNDLLRGYPTLFRPFINNTADTRRIDFNGIFMARRAA
jgi:hypothetical protein